MFNLLQRLDKDFLDKTFLNWETNKYWITNLMSHCWIIVLMLNLLNKTVMHEDCMKFSLNIVSILDFFKLSKKRFWEILKLSKDWSFEKSSNSVGGGFERFSNSVEETPRKTINFTHKVFLPLNFGNSNRWRNL